MSLRFAILTALAEKPSTGIELARRFDRSIGYFWPASHQQIYRELDKLVGDGLIVASEPSGPPSRGNPRAFSVTEHGREALGEWAAQIEPPRDTRNPLMVRMRAAAVLGEPDPAPLLAAELAAHEARLAAYEEMNAKHFSGELSRSALMQQLILQGGIDSERMWVQWCRNALDQL